MKRTIMVTAFTATLLMVTNSYARAETCAARQAEIEKQLKIARHVQNNFKVAGLEKALQEVKMHCTDKGMQENRQRKAERLKRKIAEKQRDIDDVTADIQRDKLNQNQRKLSRHQRKLADKQRDLQRLQEDLNAL